jgi:glycosyltransferase involved in cell wall biosynthesis
MSDRLTVGYVDHAGVLGGAEVALDNLLTCLDRDRWRPVAILGGRGAFADRLLNQGVPVHVLALPSSLARIRQGGIEVRSILNPGRGVSAGLYVTRLARHLRAGRVDLVHANSLRACILAGLAGRLARIPVVWQIHSIVAPPMMSPAGVRLMRALARRLPRHIICNSAATAACLEVPASRISVVPCGVDPSRFHPNGQPASGARQVGVIARFSPLKGQHVFVQAASQLGHSHPDVQFVLAGSALFGEDGYEREVREMARRSSRASQIHFLGFAEDVPRLLADLEVVVQPSTHPEGLGQVVIEAMMAGKPVIASATGGAVGLIEDRVTGRLVPADDPTALATAIDALLVDRPAAVAMGDRGRQRALEQYDLHTTTRAIEAVYQRVLTDL